MIYTPHNTLPHGPGMNLLDEVVAHDTDSATCALTIHTASRFFEPGRGVPGWVGIEYMAQCVGVWVGIQRLQAGKPIAIGLLLGTRSYECSRDHFPEGQRLLVRSELLVRDGEGVGVFACELGDGETVWARADVKAFQPDHIEEYFRMLVAEETT